MACLRRYPSSTSTLPSLDVLVLTCQAGRWRCRPAGSDDAGQQASAGLGGQRDRQKTTHRLAMHLDNKNMKPGFAYGNMA